MCRLSAAGRFLRCKPGFALVITLALMVLLTLLVLGLLTLASVSLRTVAQAEAMATARANARLSMLLALGELQRQAGNDTRVTARADILAESNPPVLGVWQSWQGDDHQTTGAATGRPKSPGNNYRSVKDSRFVAWLTSANQVDRAILPNTAVGGGKVTVLGAGAVGTERTNLQVQLAPTPVASGRLPGSVAWWIGGENQKARLPRPYQADPVTSAARWAAQGKAHSVADPEPFRLEKLLDLPALADKAISLRQADLIAQPAAATASQEFFHDLSAVSVGLLTNTATGGWRKDLSLLSESWSSQPSSGLPLFRVSSAPDRETAVTRASTNNPFVARSMFYPWADYSMDYHGGLEQSVVSWDNLIDYVTFYKRSGDVTVSPAGKRSATASSVSHYGGMPLSDFYKHLHKVRIYPVIARIQWVFSHWGEPVPNDPAKAKPRLLMTPVITLWNPYDLEINDMQNLLFELKILPVAFSYQIGTSSNSNYNCVVYVNDFAKPITHLPSLANPTSGGDMGYVTYRIDTTGALKPGETRVFSPDSNDRRVADGNGGPWGSSHCVPLIPGYRGTGGHIYPVRDQNGEIGTLPVSTSIKANARFDAVYAGNQWIAGDGVGVYLEMSPQGTGSTYSLAYRTRYSEVVANALHPPITGSKMPQTTLGAVQNSPMPFLSILFGPRITTKAHDATKGFVQCSPFGNFSPTYYRDTNQSYKYAGSGHPINSRFDYSFVAHPTGGGSNLPNASNTSNSGFIITGVNSSDGVPRCVVAELPSRPLSSIGELVNWDLRYENPCPPFAFNLVGNSDATPLLPAKAVVNSNDDLAKGTKNLRFDDSYCANHLLFDDWFFSGIAPDPTHFGTAGRTQKTTFTEFITGKTPLSNRAYQPLLEDRAAATADRAAANRLFTERVLKNTSYRSIAARLEVEGMFNVNSTSVRAWRALLGHARNQCIPYIRKTGNGWDIKLSAETDHATSRFSIPGDVEAGSPPGGGEFPEATEFTGYRKLDDEFLDALAEEVVAEIRRRGPFLSLSEFVNRQLSSDNELALAGALQAAINTLTQLGGKTNPLAVIQGASTQALANPPGGASPEDQAGYKFYDAAVGYSSYGLPGWTRQADILRPLAPILSVRDDTFTIRAYGDARDAEGKILARAVCEAVVRRTREFVDPAEAADITTAPARPSNKIFGRRFELVSLRWLAASEV
jgi:Tfp pilus assembly protein PilX